MSSVRFDMPHALVTLTVTESDAVEIEVWPKQGQSAFVVVPPDIARQIADHIQRLADEADGVGTAADEADQTDATNEPGEAPVLPANVFDLMSRRAARQRHDS